MSDNASEVLTDVAEAVERAEKCFRLSDARADTQPLPRAPSTMKGNTVELCTEPEMCKAHIADLEYSETLTAFEHEPQTDKVKQRILKTWKFGWKTCGKLAGECKQCNQ